MTGNAWVDINIMDTAALVLKHQAVSIHSADYLFTALDQFHKKCYM